MRIIYVSNCCSKDTNEKVHEIVEGFIANASQKFHFLLLEGLNKNGDNDIHAVSYIPLNKKSNVKAIDFEDDIQNGIHFHYLKSKNILGIKNIYEFFQLKRSLKKLCTKDSVIIYDVLRLTCVEAVLSFAKRKKIRCYGVVTDIPTKRAKHGNFVRRCFEKMLLKRLYKCDGYVFMTEAMNKFVNKNNKPWCLIECFCDSSVEIEKKENSSSTIKTCIYAGTLNKIYGIKMLVEAFIEANIPNSKLKIFGIGDYSNELKEICKNNPNIEYDGLVSNEFVVEEEKNATLLINPRPNIGEYTKYSFPSKTLEYMVSGTPVLCFKLDGIPEDYYEYVYTIEDYSKESFVNSLTNILSKDNNELEEFGKRAAMYVLQNKNNIILTKRIIDLISGER